ncbi:hypothetical protein [Streptomyces roseoviridis]|uniref:Uncharacterized protein n=1 Tax=Streptomyces roseoviridis TaxID=67361 RepID=A0ABV5QWV2_9ACTN
MNSEPTPSQAEGEPEMEEEQKTEEPTDADRPDVPRTTPSQAEGERGSGPG